MLPNLEVIIKNKKFTHAYVFAGVESNKNLATAMRFAKFLLCQNPGNEPCGKCEACDTLIEGQSPDLYVVQPIDSNIGVEQIRSMGKAAYIKPLNAKRKVFVIDQAEKMTVQAQNSLLKILEDPPGDSVIILSTVNYNSLLATIRSRVAKEEAKGAGFSIDYSLDISGEVRQKIVEIVISTVEKSCSDVFQFYTFFEANKQRIDYILDNMLILYRDFLIVKSTKTTDGLINIDKKDMILDNEHKFSAARLVRNTEIVEKTRKYIKQNANYQLSIEVMLMSLQEVTVYV